MFNDLTIFALEGIEYTKDTKLFGIWQRKISLFGNTKFIAMSEKEKSSYRTIETLDTTKYDSPPWKRKLVFTDKVHRVINKDKDKDRPRAKGVKPSVTEISFFKKMLHKLNAIFGSTKTLSHPQLPQALP